MPRTYRVAVIGRTGRGNYGHGLDLVWKAFDNVEIVAVADEDAKGRAAAAERLQAKNAYADYRQMLTKERPQIVSVADRWLDRHRDMVVACAESGASIFLEKPFCRFLDEADAMVTACERHHVKLAVAHQTRYSPRLRRVQELIAQGRLGDLIEMRGRGKEDARGGGQDLMVLGTHIMDLMRFIAGDPRWCFARVTQDGRPVVRQHVREGAPNGLRRVVSALACSSLGIGSRGFSLGLLSRLRTSSFCAILGAGFRLDRTDQRRQPIFPPHRHHRLPRPGRC
jgi:predicted dehydrogenase